MKVTCYPVAGKAKSIHLCEAFAAGCGGRLSASYVPGPAMFYGIDASNLAIWRQVRAAGDDFYYMDNSYFDHTRGAYFRITKNRLQTTWDQRSDGKRWLRIEEPMREWADPAGHVVVCPQSDSFMRDVVGFRGEWPVSPEVVHPAVLDPNRRVRPWARDKKRASSTLPEDLRGARLLVTYSSAAAVTATLYGVPISVSKDCALFGMPFEKNARHLALCVLADNQWTVPEIRAGVAWEKVK